MLWALFMNISQIRLKQLLIIKVKRDLETTRSSITSMTSSIGKLTYRQITLHSFPKVLTKFQVQAEPKEEKNDRAKKTKSCWVLLHNIDKIGQLFKSSFKRGVHGRFERGSKAPWTPMLTEKSLLIWRILCFWKKY